jgi:hypothetical protein
MNNSDGWAWNRNDKDDLAAINNADLFKNQKISIKTQRKSAKSAC